MINNMVQLREKLAEIMEKIDEQKIDAKSAKEIGNIAGKIIASVNTELKGAEINKTNHRIAWILSSESTTKSTSG